MRCGIFLLLLSSFLLFTASNSFAAKTPLEWEQDLSLAISKMTGMETENVDELKKMHGYAGTLLIADIAEKANKPLEIIMADRGTGMDWDDIIEKHDLNEDKTKMRVKKNLESLKGKFKKTVYNRSMEVINDID
jgi:hypothetical protein